MISVWQFLNFVVNANHLKADTGASANCNASIVLPALIITTVVKVYKSSDNLSIIIAVQCRNRWALPAGSR